MIWIAAITEAGIQNWPDCGILLAIQFINASLGYYEIVKAGDAVAALKKSLKPLATVKRDGKWSKIDATVVVPGDLVLLASGSAIPADCLVNEGVIEVDQAALTGESLPVTMYKGSSCKMGSNVVRGEVEGTVEFTGGNTFFGKTASLLQGNDEISNFQRVLLKIVIVLVIVSFVLSGIVFGYLLGSSAGFEESLSFTVVLIVASIPVAIEIVCTTTLALGSKELSKHGAIVTRLAAIEDMAGMNMLCSDKTGTLTMNKMMIQDETPVYLEGETQYSILRYAAMAAKWHEPPRDALDIMVLGQADLASLVCNDCR
jgi:H+-transporting ATPase